MGKVTYVDGQRHEVMDEESVAESEVVVEEDEKLKVDPVLGQTAEEVK
jgi:hypothetical protein